MSNILHTSRPWPRLLVGATLLAGLALVGCDNRDDTALGGDRSDTAGARVDQTTDAAQRGVGNAVDATSTAIADTGITVAIKAQLADDEQLHVMDISVETTSGRAQLTGTAPDAAARERATQIAAAVDGVTSVDNRLTIAN